MLVQPHNTPYQVRQTIVPIVNHILAVKAPTPALDVTICFVCFAHMILKRYSGSACPLDILFTSQMHAVASQTHTHVRPLYSIYKSARHVAKPLVHTTRL